MKISINKINLPDLSTLLPLAFPAILLQAMPKPRKANYHIHVEFYNLEHYYVADEIKMLNLFV